MFWLFNVLRGRLVELGILDASGTDGITQTHCVHWSLAHLRGAMSELELDIRGVLSVTKTGA